MNVYLVAQGGAETIACADPVCGDHCDACGDCLRCFGEDACGRDGGDHVWVVYHDRVEGFYARHPDAIPTRTELPR